MSTENKKVDTTGDDLSDDQTKDEKMKIMKIVTQIDVW